MLKVLKFTSGIIFGVFALAIFGLLMSLTYEALGRIFPQSFINQLWGLILFDIAAICWALAFAFKSGTVQQYAVCALGFLVAFVGTMTMVGAEVMLSGSLVETNNNLGQWLVYGFIIVTALHTALLYAYHFGSAALKQEIEVGIARGEITTEAINQATHQLDMNKVTLAETIRNSIVANVQRDLGLTPAVGTIFQPPASVQTIPHPVAVIEKVEPKTARVPLAERTKFFLQRFTKRLRKKS